MDTLLNSLRDILGTPDFYKQMGGGSYQSYSWDYGAMLEYALAGMLLLVVVSYVFRFIKWIFFK